jgi:1-deoxy-D-xylulose-5-phosphate reductoisomerase
VRCCVVQIRQFKPKLVAIKDASKVKQLQELIKDVSPQPEILVGDEGAVEVRSLTRFDQALYIKQL